MLTETRRDAIFIWSVVLGESLSRAELKVVDPYLQEPIKV